MYYGSTKFGIILVTIFFISHIHADQNQNKAFFPDPGFICCSIVPGLVCSIAESIIAGIIFSSCPCSAVCTMMDRNQLESIEDNSKNMQLLDHLPCNTSHK